jgi:hypothetical protein
MHYATDKVIAAATDLAMTTPTTPPTTTTLRLLPQHYEGSGDNIVDLTTPVSNGGIVHITGNQRDAEGHGPQPRRQARLEGSHPRRHLVGGIP